MLPYINASSWHSNTFMPCLAAKSVCHIIRRRCRQCLSVTCQANCGLFCMQAAAINALGARLPKPKMCNRKAVAPALAGRRLLCVWRKSKEMAIAPYRNRRVYCNYAWQRKRQESGEVGREIRQWGRIPISPVKREPK